MTTMLSVVLTLVAVFVVLVLAAAVTVYRRPLAVAGWFSRSALGRAGLRRTRVSTSVGGVDVWIGGDGPLLVLLHGAGDQAGTWARVAPALLRRYRVFAFDLPGHANSEPHHGPLSVGTVVLGLEEGLSTLARGEPAILVGNSLGAWVALLLAARRPDLAARLVLVNGGALKGERTDITFTPANRDEARRTIALLMGPSATRAPGFVLDDLVRVARSGPLGRLTQTAGEMDQYVLDGRLNTVATPVELLWGADDQVFPISYARRMAAGLPAVRLTVLDGCGHVPHRSDAPRFTRALLDVLDQPAAAATAPGGIR